MAARLEGTADGRRRAWLVAGLLVAVVALSLVVARWTGRGESTPTAKPTAASASTLPERTLEVGAVTVKVRPTEFGDTGAVIKVSFDTHSVDLGIDVAGGAQLAVNGTSWPVAGWSGDGPGGHHRSGELRFNAGGPATGTATLTIGGLPEPVVATWTVGG